MDYKNYPAQSAQAPPAYSSSGQPSYQPPPPPQPQPTIMVQQTIPGTYVLGREPAFVNCPNCHLQVQTRVTGENGAFAWLMTALCCLICCPLGWVPLCTECSQDVTHTCPNCNVTLGIDKRI